MKNVSQGFAGLDAIMNKLGAWPWETYEVLFHNTLVKHTVITDIFVSKSEELHTKLIAFIPSFNIFTTFKNVSINCAHFTPKN